MDQFDRAQQLDEMHRDIALAEHQRRTRPGAAIVDFTPSAGRLARVHHFGLEDQVRPGIRHRYAARTLLGINAADRAAIADALLAHLTKWRS
jgi:hypothetical protein